jgi:hypothetical protein
MSEDAGRSDEPYVRESVDSFRRAGMATGDGFRELYGWGRSWFERRHSSVRSAIVVAVWFGENWTYNRVASHIIEVTLLLLRQVTSKAIILPSSTYSDIGQSSSPCKS